jgi:hypothetical protein
MVFGYNGMNRLKDCPVLVCTRIDWNLRYLILDNKRSLDGFGEKELQDPCFHNKQGQKGLEDRSNILKFITEIFSFFVLLFICAYKAWVISPPCLHPFASHPLHPLPLSPNSSIPSRNYFALISNFVEERV